MSEKTGPVANKSGADDIAQALKWSDDGLIPVIAQDHISHEVLMFAWMSREALMQTISSGKAVYWSRSRRKLWQKGEESGHVQYVFSVRTDCDGDVLLLRVEQTGVACHTGRRSCFFNEWADGEWRAVEPVIKHPKEGYTS